MHKLLAYLQLFRLPNVFTAIADVVMGFLFVHGTAQPAAWILLLVLASCLLYTAGMVLNDVFDVDIDRKDRPNRPLPSGRIDVAWARKLGFAMLAGGVVAGFLVGPGSGVIAGLLAFAVYMYDAVVKQTAIAPIVMGSCRTLNVLLGMSCASVMVQADQMLIAVGLGTYVAGITWFARYEARQSDRWMLIFGLSVMAAGVVLLSVFPWFTQKPLLLRSEIIWPTLLVLLLVSVTRRCVIAIVQPVPENVQAAVKHSILSLVVLDAAVVMAVVGPFHAVGVIALLIPTLFLGRWVYST